MHRKSVDFPEPEGPRMTTTSPTCNVKAHPAQCVNVAEVLVDILNVDNRRRHHLPPHAPSLLQPCDQSGREEGHDEVQQGDQRPDFDGIEMQPP